MITKPTVLVLGAGASIPYGYPSGAGLVKDIVLSISNTNWKEIYNAYGVTDSEMYSLRSELHLSQKPSIDTFLEHRPEFLKAGKVAIALSLLSNENPDTFNDFGIRDRGIYHFLYNSLTTSWEEFSRNRITFITFNYDRSLEYFLFSALKHSYNKSDAEIAEAMQSIPIIHVHGSLGPLPWQAPGGTDYYPLFGRRDESYNIGKRIRIATENIVIVSEAQPKSKEFLLAFERLKNAERIYFIGFGYLRVNLERLGISQLKFMDETFEGPYNYDSYTIELDESEAPIYKRSSAVKPFRGSAFGLGKAQMQSIQNEWRIGLLDNKSDALQFLKEYAYLD